MKKITSYLFAFCFLLSAFSLYAQQPQFPDSSFENNWTRPTGPNGPCDIYQTEYFYTLNSLFFEDNAQGPADITAIKDPNAQDGDWCIQLVSGVIPVGDDIFLPGMVGTINEDFVQEFLSNDSGKITVASLWENETPHALEGWYKYMPVKEDSALIEIGFYNYLDEDPVFIAKMIVKDATGTNWKKFTIVIPEQHRNKIYTYIRVLFVASAGVNFDKLTECKGQKGSALWIDNISLNYELGVKQDFFSTLKAKTFPNPATEVLNIELNEHFAGNILVYDLSGRKIMENNINGTEYQLNISALTTGNYLYKLMNENTIFAQGKFVVTK